MKVCGRQMQAALIAFFAPALLALPAAGKGAEWLRGYQKMIFGTTIAYHSVYPDISAALLVRATDGTMAVEWETEPVPAGWENRPGTFIWMAGLATGKGGHRFELAVDGQAALAFTTSHDSSRKEWRVEGAGGISLAFETAMVDQFDELFGFMRLEVPASFLHPGRPLRLKITGEAGRSNDWVMVFQDDLRRDVSVTSDQVLIRKKQGLFQVARVEISHVAPPGRAVVSCEGRQETRLNLRTGYNALEFLVPAVESERRAVIEVSVDGGPPIKRSVLLRPVVPREIWLLPHSHVDIGYSDPQPVVEKNHWRYFREAIDLARKTAGYPEGARFRWNVEQSWAVESFFRQASAADRADFIEALRKGWIGLQATLAGVLTGLCHPEELIHLTDFSRRLGATAGIAVDSAMATDIPSQSWSLVPALAMTGVKYLSSGPNYMPSLPDGGDRIGWALRAWGDRPFYWVSPSGEQRILFWMAGRGYSWFHGLHMGSISKAPLPQIFQYINELAEKDYPYSMVQVRYTIGGDNGPPDPELSDFVRKWNEEYASPRLVIATASEMFREFERRHGASVPVVRGDFTGYWEDGAASTAAETAANRMSAERLIQAETLWSILGKDGFPTDRFDEAWRQVILFSEHTWGAADSISNPDGENARAQWAYKKAFAEEASRMSRQLFEEATERAPAPSSSGPETGVAERKGIDVINTCSWERTDIIILPPGFSPESGLVRDDLGKAVPAQRLREGGLAFIARSVPGFGARRYFIEPGSAGAKAAPQAEASARIFDIPPGGGKGIRNGLISAGVSPDSGAISSFRWSEGAGRELVDPGKQAGLGHYLYVPGVDPRTARAASRVTVRDGERGPLVASLVVESDAPGAKGLVREYRLVSGLARLDLSVTIDKEKVREKESVHIAFPLRVPGGTVRVDVGWGFVRPEVDQIPGACRDFFCARNSVDISSAEYGLTWTTLDAPLVEIGAMTDETPGPGERRSWLRSITPSSLLYSYALNNYWHTNYKADQEGRILLRYAVEPHSGQDTAAAKRLSAEAMTPLVPVPAVNAGSVPRFPVAVDSGSFVATSLRPTADGQAWLLRLLNASDRPEKLRLSGEAFDRGLVFLLLPGEAHFRPVSGPVDVPGFGIVTLRISRGR